MEKRIRDPYCGFTDDTINILAKIIVRTQSNGTNSEVTRFFITGGHESNLLGKDNLPKLGIEVKQKKCSQPVCSVSQPPFQSKWIKPYSPTDKLFIKVKELFLRVGKIPNDHKIRHFLFPFKPVQAKGRRVPLHFLAGYNEELRRMDTEDHIIKVEKYDEDCFISPIVTTRKKDGSIKLALDSKLLNEQIFKKKPKAKYS